MKIDCITREPHKYCVKIEHVSVFPLQRRMIMMRYITRFNAVIAAIISDAILSKSARNILEILAFFDRVLSMPDNTPKEIVIRQLREGMSSLATRGDFHMKNTLGCISPAIYNGYRSQPISRLRHR